MASLGTVVEYLTKANTTAVEFWKQIGLVIGKGMWKNQTTKRHNFELILNREANRQPMRRKHNI